MPSILQSPAFPSLGLLPEGTACPLATRWQPFPVNLARLCVWREAVLRLQRATGTWPWRRRLPRRPIAEHSCKQTDQVSLQLLMHDPGAFPDVLQSLVVTFLEED